MNSLRLQFRRPGTRQLAACVQAGGLVVTAIIALTSNLVFNSTSSETEASLAELIRNNQQLLQQRADVTSAVEEAECELFAMNQRLHEISALIPEAPEESRFLAQLSRLANDCDLRIRNFRPNPAEPEDQLRRIRVQLKGAGQYECICAFLDGLQELPRLTQVSRFRIDPLDADELYPIELELSIFHSNSNVPHPMQIAEK